MRLDAAPQRARCSIPWRSFVNNSTKEEPYYKKRTSLYRPVLFFVARIFTLRDFTRPYAIPFALCSHLRNPERKPVDTQGCQSYCSAYGCSDCPLDHV